MNQLRRFYAAAANHAQTGGTGVGIAEAAASAAIADTVGAVAAESAGGELTQRVADIGTRLGRWYIEGDRDRKCERCVIGGRRRNKRAACRGRRRSMLSRERRLIAPAASGIRSRRRAVERQVRSCYSRRCLAGRPNLARGCEQQQ